MEQQGIVFRYPTLDDVSLMRDFINTVSKEHTFIRFQGEEVSLEEEEKFLKDQLERMKNKIGVQLLALDGNKLAGIAGIVMKDKTQQHEGVFGIIMAKDYRGKGLGRRLMEEILKSAKNLPLLKIITLAVYADNIIAQNLYKSFGFKEFGRLPEGINYKGKFIDRIDMYLKI